MIIIESAHSYPIILNEAASVLLVKTKIDAVKDKITGILSGDLKIKDPESQKELDSWMNDHENDLNKLNKALRVDVEKLYKEKTSINDFIITIGLVIVSGVVVAINPIAGLIVSCIALLESILVLIKNVDNSSKMSTAINAVKKIYKEMKKVDVKKIKNKNLQERFVKLMDEMENTLDQVGARDN